MRRLHADSLRASREKLLPFPSGWLGGAELHVQRHGRPMRRRRDLPFSIGSRARSMDGLALADMPIDEAVRQRLEQALRATADHMRNQPGPANASDSR